MVNPKDCRDFAAQCVEIANSSGDARFQTVLFIWLKPGTILPSPKKRKRCWPWMAMTAFRRSGLSREPSKKIQGAVLRGVQFCTDSVGRLAHHPFMVGTSWYHLKAELCAQMAKDAVDPSRRAHLETECRLWLQIAEAETRQDELRKKARELQGAFGFREARTHAKLTAL
jgi:hypothetical protein